jgi:hypothetical protein
VSDSRSVAGGAGTDSPATVATTSPAGSVEIVRPGAPQMLSLGSAGATTLLGSPLPYRLAADTR